VPRKNVRALAGRPLIGHAIVRASAVVPLERVIVITDDHEIAFIARGFGAEVILEADRTPSEETLDTKVIRNLPRLRELGADADDIVVTLQPTSPLVTPHSLTEAIEAVRVGGGSVISVVDDRHLRWSVRDGQPIPLFEARVNRQQLPAEFRETGGVVAARVEEIEAHGTRVIAPVRLLELPAEESVDIDSFADLYSAAHLLTRLRVAIRADAASHLGMGHIYRALAIGMELARHDVRIYTLEKLELGSSFLAGYPLANERVADDRDFLAHMADFKPDLVVLDVLDTTEALVDAIRAASSRTKIVTFEDLGTGAFAADLLVAEFVNHTEVPEERQLQGVQNAILAPAFDSLNWDPEFRPHLEHVLVLFGGTDPNDLADRALDALERLTFEGRVTVVRGLGARPISTARRQLDLEVLTDVRYMPEVLSRADLAFTSAGRTIFELATMGVPSICIAQNLKELAHRHATEEYGVRALGLATRVADSQIDEEFSLLAAEPERRRKLQEAALRATGGRSNHRVLGRILDRLGFDPFPNL